MHTLSDCKNFGSALDGHLIRIPPAGARGNFRRPLRLLVNCFTSILFVACATEPQVRLAESTVAPSVASPSTARDANLASLKLGSGSVLLEPGVFPGTVREVDTLCDYLTQSRGLGTDSRSQDQGRTCRRAQLAKLNDRRLSCIQRDVSKSAASTSSIENCLRQGQSFETALQDKRDFDRFEQISTVSEFSALVQKWVATGDRLGLLRETRLRMNAFCERGEPMHTSRMAWVAALEDYRRAGPGGACVQLADSAQRAILQIDQKEQLAALAAAKSWKQLDEFLEQFSQSEVTGVLAQAVTKRDRARLDEINGMRSLAPRDLERFWRNSADLTPEMKGLARARLIEVSLAENSFAGVMRASRVTGDPTYVQKNQGLARTSEEKRQLEEWAVVHTATPGRFFRLTATVSHGQPLRDEITHAGLFALYTMTGAIPTQGVFTVQRATDAPGLLSLGRYRVQVEAVLNSRQRVERYSSVLGNADTFKEITTTRRVFVSVGPPSMSGSASFDFGPVTAVAMQRGSAGGFETERIIQDPVVQLRIIGVEVVSGDQH